MLKILGNSDVSERAVMIQHIKHMTFRIRGKRWGQGSQGLSVGPVMEAAVTSLACLNIELQSVSSSGSGKICPNCPWKTKMSCNREGIMDGTYSFRSWEFPAVAFPAFYNYAVNLQNGIFNFMKLF